MRRAAALGLITSSILAAACGGAGRPSARAPDPTASPREGSAPTSLGARAGGDCARQRAGTGATRVDDARQSGTVVLAQTSDAGVRRLLAYTTELDEPTLRTVDVTSGRELAVTRLRGHGEHAIVLADGRVAVTLRREGLVEVLEPAARPEDGLTSRCAVEVPTEPIAMATTIDDGALLVTSGISHALTTLDGVTLARRRTRELPREPRAVVASDDGGRAFVAHVVGARMSVVELDDRGDAREIDLHQRLGRAGLTQRGGKLREGCQGFALAKAVPFSEGAMPPHVGERPVAPPPAKPVPPPAPKPGSAPASQGRIFAPFVTVDPGVSTRVTSGYGDASSPLAPEVSSVTVIDPAAERAMTRSALTLSRREAPKDDCLLPRAATAGADSLFVACLGIDSVLELDARAVDPARAELRRWKVPAGPTGLALDRATGTLVVLSQFDRQLTILTLGDVDGGRQLALSRSPDARVTPELALGRALFHRTGDPMISADGRACASCHPDGREDALTWSTPDGPRQTAMLAGRLDDTGPFSWSGAHATVEEHVAHTFQRLGGTGLPPAQTQALIGYIRQLPTPRALERAGDERRARVARGKELFFDGEVACATCHVGPQTTDGARHDVGTRTSVERSELETPSLRFVGATAPYFHDGRYKTLLEMLEAPDSKMGRTTHLSRADRLSLVAYLETL